MLSPRKGPNRPTRLLPSSRACWAGAAAYATALALELCATTAQAQGMDDWTLGSRYPAPPPPPPVGIPPVAPPAPPALWQLEPVLSGSLYTLHAPSVPNASGNRVSGGLGVRGFFAPIIDDGAPRSLQPFLQRASSVYVGLSAGGFATSRGNATRSNRYFSVAPSVDFYVTRWLALSAGADYSYSVLSDDGVSKTHSIGASAGLGVRGGNARVDLRYAFRANNTDGTFTDPRWGTLTLSVFAVFFRSFRVSVYGQLLDAGAIGGVDLGYYATPDLGFFLGGFGGRGHLYSDNSMVDRAGGSAGLSYWFAPSFRLGPTYGITYNKVRFSAGSGYEELDHALTIDGVLRLP